ncbi:MAG TPA: hypothetical protein VKS80_09185, partial [Trinickia sp.]|nr:hypothetical protein [Trinickia sp.]
LPRLELPPVDTEAGVLARMLLSENAGPAHESFANQTEAHEAMRWMVNVLKNRLKLGSQHFSAGRQATTLKELIKAPNQIEGFGDYPNIAEQSSKNIRQIVDIANDGTHAHHSIYRAYLESALTIATVQDVGMDPCPTSLYAWRTKNRASPGKNFRKYATKGGQDFYTLTDDFLLLVSRNGRVQ